MAAACRTIPEHLYSGLAFAYLPLRPRLPSSPSDGGNAPKPHPVAGFGCKVFKYLLGPHETLQERPGSNLLTTRRFTLWQNDTLGITTLLNGAWSSVPQRRSSPPSRCRYPR